jgi:hypothetical protein
LWARIGARSPHRTGRIRRRQDARDGQPAGPCPYLECRRRQAATREHRSARRGPDRPDAGRHAHRLHRTGGRSAARRDRLRQGSADVRPGRSAVNALAHTAFFSR